jgi:hypothetical protein
MGWSRFGPALDAPSSRYLRNALSAPENSVARQGRAVPQRFASSQPTGIRCIMSDETMRTRKKLAAKDITDIAYFRPRAARLGALVARAVVPPSLHLRAKCAVRPAQGRYDATAMSAAIVLIIVVALLCLALLALFAILWAALHFGVGEDDED